jgi:hypothetical protein
LFSHFILALSSTGSVTPQGGDRIASSVQFH